MRVSKLLQIFLFLCTVHLYVDGQSGVDSTPFLVVSAEDRDSLALYLLKAGQDSDSTKAEALQYAEKAIRLANSIKDKEKQAHAYLLAGMRSLDNEQVDKAKEFLLKAEKLAVKHNNPQMLGDIQFHLAKTYFDLSNYRESIEKYFIALEFFQSINNQQSIANTYQNIGLVYHNLDDLAKAEQYYQKALDINLALKNDLKTAGLYQNVGTLRYREYDYEKASDYFHNSIIIFHNLGDDQGIATSYSNLGLIKMNEGFFDEAMDYYKKALRHFNKIDLQIGQKWMLFNIAECHSHLKQYRKAEDLYNHSLEIAIRINNSEGALINYKALSDLKLTTRNFEDALYYFMDYIGISDSIHSRETQEHIAQMESNMQLRSKEKELALKELELKKRKVQNNALLSIFAILLLASIFITLAYRKKAAAEIKLAEHKSNLERIVEIRTNELEDQIRNRKNAEEADKLKSAFLANMSHELRTPMNAIIAFSNFLREPDLNEALRNEYLNHINSAGNSLLHLIDDIIDVAKIESGQLNIFIKPTDITRMMRELHKFYLEIRKKKDKAHIELELNIDQKNHYIINTDEQRLKQIMRNLMDNALKYTDEGCIEFGFTANGTHIQLFVRDTGAGIPDDKQELIFDRFYQLQSKTTEYKHSGTGLGLAICKNLTELLGGSIHVKSEVGKGSVFYVDLPVESVRKQYIPSNGFIIPEKENTNGELILTDKTILIVEDEELNYRVLNSFFSRTKANILRATNGANAIDLFKSQKIDLVLMDIQMPIMDGYDATKEIKKLNNRIPVIVQTSFAMEGEKEKCLKAGCDDFITKPLDINILTEKINHYISKT